MRSEQKKIIAASLLASLLLHVVLIWVCLTRWVGPLPTESIETFLANDPLRIVDLTEPANRIRPARAKAVGVENNATSRETVANPPVVRRSSFAVRKSTRATPGGVNNESRTTNDEAPPFAMREPTSVRPRLPATAMSEQMGSGFAAYVPEDYFPDYRHGGHTYLNVLKRPGVDYFVQLKRAFKLAWDPIPPLRAHFAANEVSRGSVQVVLGVSVDRQGNLGELFILKGSGLGRYDAEALRTVRASSPFASPPVSLVAADGTVRMSWTFIVYL